MTIFVGAYTLLFDENSLDKSDYMGFVEFENAFQKGSVSEKNFWL